jgi:hypothetical protein
MNRFVQSIALGSIALLSAVSTLAHADALAYSYVNGLNLSASTCMVNDIRGWTSNTFAGDCIVAFPINLPAGVRINQIALIHSGDFGTAAGIVSAQVEQSEFKAPFDSPQPLFPIWDNGAYSPLAPTLTNMMQQSGKAFPDAFIVPADRYYAVTVHVARGAVVEGVVVTYQ